MNKTALLLCLFFAFLPMLAFPQAASRKTGGDITYYTSLNEAFAAAQGVSVDEPDEIAILEDITLTEPILIDTTKHIRLIPVNGSRTIQRGSSNVDNPLFRVTGENATLALGKPGMEHELFIDGGCLKNPPIQALAPLIAINGLDAKVIMYDKVTLQNNRNESDALSTSLYQLGAGVFLRSLENMQERQPEFIMKGGTIRGNVNNTHYVPCGGGVFIAGFALFTMEGGVIAGNTAYQLGGGFHTGSRGSFKKTGGIIYGSDAPDNLKNKVTKGSGNPRLYGLAVCVPSALQYDNKYRIRNTTVGENENLTFTGAQIGQEVSFGENEVWDIGLFYPEKSLSPSMIILISAASIVFAVAVILMFFYILRKRRNAIFGAALPNTTETINAPPELSPREKEIFTLLFTKADPKQIAHTLNISVHTVNNHIANIYRKSNVQSRTELFSKYIKNNK